MTRSIIDIATLLLVSLGLLNYSSASIISCSDADVRIITTKGLGVSGSSVDWIHFHNRTLIGVSDPASQAIYAQELAASLTSLKQLRVDSKLRCLNLKPFGDLTQFGRTFKFHKKNNQLQLILGSPTMKNAGDKDGLLTFGQFRPRDAERLEVVRCERGRYTGLALATDSESESVIYSAFQDQITLEKDNLTVRKYISAYNELENYLGFAVATRGNVFSATAPRASNGRGLVVLNHSLNAFNETRVVGDQVGSYFGYSTAIGYANNASTAQLVVGNPFWLDMQNWMEDVGVVNVFNRQIVGCSAACEPRKIELKSPSPMRQGRFGAAVVTVDLNQDGHDDLVVGEPGDTRNASGAVHVYLFDPHSGSMMSSPHQSLRPADFTNQSVRLFGQSIASHVDVDRNGFPDILTSFILDGSLSLAILRTRPIVSLSASVSAPLEHFIDHDRNWNCTALSFDLPGCLAVQLCLSYKGDNLKQDQRFHVQLHADRGFRTPRVTIVTDDQSLGFPKWPFGLSTLNETFSLRYRQEMCRVWYLRSEYVAQQTEVMKRVVVSFTYSLAAEDQLSNSDVSSGFSSLPPLLINDTNYSQAETLNNNVTLQFRNLCGENQLCEIDMAANVTFPGEVYVLGRSSFQVMLNIANKLEPAYSARLNITVPAAFTAVVVDDRNATLQCHPAEIANFTGAPRAFICDIGNPFPGLLDELSQFRDGFNRTANNGNNRTYSVRFSVNDYKVALSPAVQQVVNVSFNVSSETEMNNEMDFSDNFKVLSIPLAYRLDWLVDAQSQPDQVLLDRDSQQELTGEVTYIYLLQSLREAGVQGLRFSITRVNETLSGESLMQLVSIHANGKRLHCDSKRLPHRSELLLSDSAASTRISKRETQQQSQQSESDTWWPFWSQASQRTELELDCDGDDSPVRCVVHSCTMQLARDDVVTLKVKVQLEPRTLLSIDPSIVMLLVPTQLRAEVTDLSYVDTREFSLLTRALSPGNLSVTRSFSLPVFFKVDQKAPPPPVWALVAAIIVGTIMLVFVIALLVYCGFFKRRRPPTETANSSPDSSPHDADELTVPLNGNVSAKLDDPYASAGNDWSDGKQKGTPKSNGRKSKPNKVASTADRQTLLQVVNNGPHMFAPQLLQVPNRGAIPDKFLSEEEF